MFSRDRDVEVEHTYETPSRTATVARGGVSLWSILTGVLVAFGVMFLLSAIAGAVIVNAGLIDEIESGSTVEVGVGAIVAIALAQFIAYLWGGYTAGRMARGSGFANGLLVPILALVIAAVVAGIAYALDETASLGLPFAENRLPVNNDALIDLGVAGGIATLAAMLFGGLIGGVLGSRWHTKLERKAIADHEAKSIDLREGRTTTHDTAVHETTPAPATAPPARDTGFPHRTAETPTTANEAATIEHQEPIHTRPRS
jgi:hypothetical protein